ncbi:RagB/SusD family nutrient uptake outer membrane protein [Reichenbachiella versicolor]|uniref:RagB/SusD family nutrient uptake outer membrane protein n=1 Tax=Reichenbachiella versicolor TaxID=1821036 RepID=UPI0013A5BD49|nr:RagB/SusD family nutrient uptake outer membrane protein [Reichenbachiella versicolor]
MKIFKTITIMLASVLMVSITGCEDYFEEQKNPNRIPVEEFWKTLNEVQYGVFACYRTLANSQAVMFRYESDRSDLTWPGFGRPNTTNVFYNQNFNEASGDINNKYSRIYTGIFQANQVITALENMDASQLPTKADTLNYNFLMGQGRFFRGLFHFWAYNSFNNGEVVVVDKIPETEEELYPTVNRDKEKTVQFILEDLEFAMNNLVGPESLEGIEGLASAGTAAALIGKVHLYEGNWREAIEHFEKTYEYGYSLTPFYGDNFNIAGEHNSESILEINYALFEKSELGINDANQISNSYNRLVSPVGGFRSIYPSAWLAVQYKKDSIDKSNPVYTQHPQYSDLDLDEGMGTDPHITGQVKNFYSLRTSYSIALVDDDSIDYYQDSPARKARFNGSEYAYFKKFSNWENFGSENDVSNVLGRSALNFSLIRLADVYLMHAEALLQLSDGSLTEAMALVNRVRFRAGAKLIGSPAQNPDYDHGDDALNRERFYYNVDGSGAFDSWKSITDGEELMQHIMYVERPLELAIEGHAIRQRDLRRWGVLKERFDGLKDSVYYSEDHKYLAFDETRGESGEFVSRQKFGVVIFPGLDPDQTKRAEWTRIYADYRTASENFREEDHAYLPIPNGEITANPFIFGR